MRPLPFLALVAACAATRVAVDRQPGLDGSWSMGAARLDVTGSTATLSWHGRVLVFEGVRGLRGHIGEEEVSLESDGLRIVADAERVAVSLGRHFVERRLADLPPGRWVWGGGNLRPG